MSVLTVVQQVAALCQQTRPNAVVSSSDPLTQQFLAFVQQEGDELAREFDWRALKAPLQMLGDGSTTLFALPSDFDRFPILNPLWSSAYAFSALRGPVADDELLALKNSNATGFAPVWHLIGKSVEFFPSLGATEVVNSTYLSSSWILGSDNVTRKAVFTADSDLPLLSESLLTLGAVWRWKSSKGLEYAEDFRTAQERRQLEAAHDRGSRAVNMARKLMPDADRFFPGLITPVGPTVS